MSAELDELYQSIILDQNRRPQNFRAMESSTGHADGVNPMCGDQVTVWVKRNGDTLEDVSFQGQGCSISKASASLMTAAIKGKTKAEAEKLFEDFHDLITGKTDGANLGRLKAFGGVFRFPLRVKCASLAWHAMKSALETGAGTLSTEPHEG